MSQEEDSYNVESEEEDVAEDIVSDDYDVSSEEEELPEEIREPTELDEFFK